jgi:hypothetical protein
MLPMHTNCRMPHPCVSSVLQAHTTMLTGPPATAPPAANARMAQQLSRKEPVQPHTAASVYPAGVTTNATRNAAERGRWQRMAHRAAARTQIPTARRARRRRLGTAFSMSCKMMCISLWRFRGWGRIRRRIVWRSGVNWRTGHGEEQQGMPFAPYK